MCKKQLERAFSDIDHHPAGGAVFTSKGNYGSTVWDEGWTSGRSLHIIICDECLVVEAEDVLVMNAFPTTRFTYQAWEPDEPL